MDHFDHLSRSNPAEAPGQNRDQLAASGCPGQIITHLVIWHSSCRIDDLELEVLQQRAAASDISLSQLLHQSLDLPCTRFDDTTQQAA